MSTPILSLSSGNFRACFAQLISPAKVAALSRQHRTSAAGAPATLSAFGVVAGLVFHVLQASGLLSTHVRQVAGRKTSDSALSERRQGMGMALFQALLDFALGCIAQVSAHPRAFYKGFLLTGIDGSTRSVSNTPPIKAKAKKARSRRHAAAFHKLSMAALYELGTHNPLAVRIGVSGESEMQLATPLLKILRQDWLLIADRYYGMAKFVLNLMSLPTPIHFLLRVRKNLKSKQVQRLRDGSYLVQIRDNTSRRLILLREIHARVRRRSGQWITIRLWTNLLDPKRYPATELVPPHRAAPDHVRVPFANPYPNGLACYATPTLPERSSSKSRGRRHEIPKGIGARWVADFELVALAKILSVPVQRLCAKPDECFKLLQRRVDLIFRAESCANVKRRAGMPGRSRASVST